MSMYSKWMEKSHEKHSCMKQCKNGGECVKGMDLNSLKRLNPVDIEEALDGNLCRCTGYRPILEGFYQLVNRENEVPEITGAIDDPNVRLSCLEASLSPKAIDDCIGSPESTTTSESSEGKKKLCCFSFSNSVRDVSTTVSFENSTKNGEEMTLEQKAIKCHQDFIPKGDTKATAVSMQLNPELKNSLEWLVQHEAQQEQIGNHLRLLNASELPLYLKAR